MIRGIKSGISFVFIFLLTISFSFAKTSEVKETKQGNNAGLTVSPMVSAENLWKHFFKENLPAGVIMHNITYTGYKPASGLYSGFPTFNGNIYPDDGILLTSGIIDYALGPNDMQSKSYPFHSTDSVFKNPGDDELLKIAKEHVAVQFKEDLDSYSAAVLTIEFTTDTSIHNISFEFIYGSEEYDKYLNTNFNDIFCAILDGKNISYDSNNKPVCVNNNFFKIDNRKGQFNLQYNGFTPLLCTSVPISPGRHKLKFAICDISDDNLDSGIFLSRFRFNSSIGYGTQEVLYNFIQNTTFSIYQKHPVDSIVGKINSLDNSKIKFIIIDKQNEFLLNESNGALTLSPQTVLNAELKSKYTFKVTASDGKVTDTALITVNVFGDNIIDNQTFSIKEYAQDSSLVGKIKILIPKKVTLTIIDSQNEFLLNETYETLIVSPEAQLNAITKNVYTFKISAVWENLKDTALITVNILPRENLIDDQTFSIKEDAQVNSLVGKIQTLISQKVNFVISGSQKEFLLDNTDGTLTLSPEAQLNAETKNSHTFKVVAIIGNNKDTALITVNILPRENLINDQTFSIKENAPANSLVGKIQILISQNVNFVMPGPQKEFLLNNSDGTLTLSPEAILDAELKNVYVFPVCVTYGNNKDTAQITVNIIAVPSIPVMATVFDDNGNGFIDKIVIALPDTAILINQLPSVNELLGNFKLECYLGNVVLHPANIVRIDDHAFQINITENTGSVYETGWRSAELVIKQVKITTVKKYLEVSSVVDKAGPVISSAILTEDNSQTDILDVHISEPLIWNQSKDVTAQNVFIYINKGTITEEAFKGIAAQNMMKIPNGTQVKIYITNKFMITPNMDSLQLKNISSIFTDKSGNSANVQNRIAPIEGTRKNKLTIIPYCNPYSPGTQLTSSVRDYYQDVLQKSNFTGMLVSIKTLCELTSMNDGTFGKVAIYDEVGNIVQRNIPIYKAKTGLDYGFVWDGTNSRNRLVGNGTYLAILTVKDNQNITFVEKVKLGFRNK